MLMFGARSPDPSADERKRRRRLRFVLIIGTLGLVGIVVFGPYVEFAAYLWWLRSKLGVLGAPGPIAWAVALLATSLLVRSVRSFLKATWRGQTLRQFLSLMFPALLFSAAYFLSLPRTGPLLPRIRYEAPDLVVSHSRFGNVRIPLGRKLAGDDSQLIRTRTETVPPRQLEGVKALDNVADGRATQSPAIQSVAEVRRRAPDEDFGFELNFCTSNGGSVTCDMTVTNNAAEDWWLQLLVGDHSVPGRSQMFDDHGRGYGAQSAQLGASSWFSLPNGYELSGAQVVPGVPTDAAVRFPNVSSNARTIRVLRIAYLADHVDIHNAVVKRVEFNDLPITEDGPENSEKPAELGQRVSAVVPFGVRPEPVVPFSVESKVVRYNATTALRVLLVKKEGLLSAVKRLKLPEDDDREYATFVNEWAAEMTRMIADLGRAGLVEREWQGFVVKLTAQADEMSKVLQMPRRILVYRPRNPQE